MRDTPAATSTSARLERSSAWTRSVTITEKTAVTVATRVTINERNPSRMLSASMPDMIEPTAGILVANSSTWPKREP